ncbi:MAG: signal peptidase II [Eubacteriales bacterium]|nr:signal peptidase II [Eubacteriales bacterium]
MSKRSCIVKAVEYISIIIVLIILDQITKRAAVAGLMESGPYVIIDNVLELLYVENRGAAFGIMMGMRGFFLLIAPAVSAVLFFMSLRLPDSRRYAPLKLCFILIIAGALGNFIDRLLHEYVVDFIYFMPIDFPVFNVADIYVTCSTIIMILLTLFYYSDEELNEALWSVRFKPDASKDAAAETFADTEQTGSNSGSDQK